MVKEEIRKPYLELDSSGQPVHKRVVIAKGTRNGNIIVRLSAGPCE